MREIGLVLDDWRNAGLALLAASFAIGCYDDDILTTRLNASIDDSCLEVLQAASAASSGDCAVLPAPTGPVRCIDPTQIAELPRLLSAAEPGTSFLLADGTYLLGPGRLDVFVPGTQLRGASGRADSVLLEGQINVDEAIYITASDVVVADLTLQNATEHAIHVTGASDSDVTGVILHNLVLRDTGSQLVKVNGTAADEPRFVDSGRLECSTLELSDNGRSSLDACETGGLSAHQARGWTIRKNRFEGIYCLDGSVAGHAIALKQGSRDTLVERNVIVDCARGIGFGQEPEESPRTYVDNPYPGISPISHYDGLIRNNFIAASVEQFDTGVELSQARGTRVYHNSIFHRESAFSSLDYRFVSTSADVQNNLLVRMTQRDDGQATLANNIEGATADLFVDPQTGDLHLRPGASAAIDQGAAVGDAGDDIDGAPHSIDAPDIGADEFGAP